MCEYCERNKIFECELFSNLPITDDITGEYIGSYEDGNPLQYIRYLKNKYQIITEFNNDDGDVLSLDINYCPMCGRKLGG